MKGRFLKITELRGRFLRNFDTFGPMDSFFRISCGTSSLKTDIIKGQEVNYTLAFSARIDKEKVLLISGYDEDATEDQFCGSCEVKLSDLEGRTSKQLTLFLQKEKTCQFQIFYSIVEEGILPSKENNITFYFIKLRLKNYAEFLGGGFDPYLMLTLGKDKAKTEVVQDAKGPIQWQEVIKLKKPKQSKQAFMFQVFDKDVFSDQLIGSAKVDSQSLSTNGTLTLSIKDAKGIQVGTVELNYTSDQFDIQEAKRQQEKQQLEKKQRAQQKEKERLEAIRLKMQEEARLKALPTVYLYEFALDAKVPKQVQDYFKSSLTVNHLDNQTQFQPKAQSSKATWDQKVVTMKPKDNKVTPATFTVVFENKVDKEYTLASKPIEIPYFVEDKSQLQIPLFKQGVNSGVLTVKYAVNKFDEPAQLEKAAAKAKKLKEDRLKSPYSLDPVSLYDFEAVLVPSKASGRTSFELRSGSSVLKSNPSDQNENKIQFKECFSLTPKETTLTVNISNKSQYRMTGSVELSDLTEKQGRARVDLWEINKINTYIGDFYFRYSRDSKFDVGKVKAEYEKQAKLKSQAPAIQFSQCQLVVKDRDISAQTVGLLILKTATESKKLDGKKPIGKSMLFDQQLEFALLQGQKAVDLEVHCPIPFAGTVKLSEIADKAQGSLQIPLSYNKDTVRQDAVLRCKYKFVNQLMKNRSKSQIRNSSVVAPGPSKELGSSPSEKKQSERVPSLESNKNSLVEGIRRSKGVNFGDKIYEKQSAATLQNSILAYSIPKGPRFNDRTDPAEPSYYNASSINKPKYQVASFGYGHRQPYPQWMERNMKELPAPGSYNLNPQRLNQRKGVSFGLPFSAYEKVLVAQDQSRQSQPQRGRSITQRLQPVQRVPVVEVQAPRNYHYILPKI